MIGSLAVVAFAAAVQIQATDYALAMPATIPGGVTTFTFENKGHEPHYVRFVRLADGHTFTEFEAWQKSSGPIPDWLVSSGGIGTVAPGMSEEFTTTLAPGTYVALCSYPSGDGTPHVRKGMYARLDVGAAGASTAAAMAEDLVLTMHDHGFQLSAPIGDGRASSPLWRVHNNGSEPHQLLIVRLPDGVTEWQERSWFSNGARGERHGVPIGGVIELAPDTDAWFRVALAPGRYLLLCTIVEQDGRHFDLGMIYRFTIES